MRKKKKSESKSKSEKRRRHKNVNRKKQSAKWKRKRKRNDQRPRRRHVHACIRYPLSVTLYGAIKVFSLCALVIVILNKKACAMLCIRIECVL